MRGCWERVFISTIDVLGQFGWSLYCDKMREAGWGGGTGEWGGGGGGRDLGEAKVHKIKRAVQAIVDSSTVFIFSDAVLLLSVFVWVLLVLLLLVVVVVVVVVFSCCFPPSRTAHTVSL